MTPEIESRVIAFVRVIANRCYPCLHRREENCAHCDSRTATRLLRDIEADIAVPPKDYSLFARMQLIAEALGRSTKPLLSSQIELDGLCSNQLKQWTLKRMMRIGVIGRCLAFRTRSGYCVYRYFLKREGKQRRRNHERKNRSPGASQDTVHLG